MGFGGWIFNCEDRQDIVKLDPDDTMISCVTELRFGDNEEP